MVTPAIKMFQLDRPMTHGVLVMTNSQQLLLLALGCLDLVKVVLPSDLGIRISSQARLRLLNLLGGLVSNSFGKDTDLFSCNNFVYRILLDKT